MKWLERASSLFLIGFSILIFSLSLRLGIGKPADPGPGFMPFLASAVLFCLSSLILYAEVKGPDENRKEKSPTHLMDFAKPVCLLITLLGYAFLLGVIGFLSTAFLSMFAMFSFTEPQKWHRNIVAAALIAIASFILFSKWLQVQLPTGILGI